VTERDGVTHRNTTFAADRAAAPTQPITATLVLGPRHRIDIPGACEQLRELIRNARGDPVRCHVRALPADLTTVELLARLSLTARRAHTRVVLEGATPALKTALEFCGLRDALFPTME
jgi:hypothetical protein